MQGFSLRGSSAGGGDEVENQTLDVKTLKIAETISTPFFQVGEGTNDYPIKINDSYKTVKETHYAHLHLRTDASY